VRQALGPKVTGKKLAPAKSAIRKAHCAVGNVAKAFSSTVKSGRVISQRPRPRTKLAAGAKVRLTVSEGKRR
jgi:beta-lactam-binding protein with PASTA domain